MPNVPSSLDLQLRVGADRCEGRRRSPQGAGVDELSSGIDSGCAAVAGRPCACDGRSRSSAERKRCAFAGTGSLRLCHHSLGE